MDFVAFVGNDKENWGQISALVNRVEADRIILIQNKEAEDFPASENCELIKVSSDKPMVELKDEMMNKLKIIMSREFEVMLSIASGNGKEHMALISALLSIPVGIKFVVYTKNGVQYLS